jgi:hypothetical protein
MQSSIPLQTLEMNTISCLSFFFFFPLSHVGHYMGVLQQRGTVQKSGRYVKPDFIAYEKTAASIIA